MATRSVRFEFQCQDDTLKFQHDVPAELITQDAQAAQENPVYMQTFFAAITTVLKMREKECRAASSSKCQICGSPSNNVLQTPMSWLHMVDDPFVTVWVSPVCGKEMCEMQTRQQIQDMMALMGSSEPEGEEAGKPSDSKEIMPCKICGKTGDTLKCGRCRVVAYCGKEHQKQDWKVHKHICTLLAK